MADQEMFRRVHDMITEFPELHDQKTWEAEPGYYGNTSCGTTRCIAGWAVWCAAKDQGLLSRKRDEVDHLSVLSVLGERYGVASCCDSCMYVGLGAAILGISEDEANSLFHEMDNVRALKRVESFAFTGKDLPRYEAT